MPDYGYGYGFDPEQTPLIVLTCVLIGFAAAGVIALFDKHRRREQKHRHQGLCPYLGLLCRCDPATRQHCERLIARR